MLEWLFFPLIMIKCFIDLRQRNYIFPKFFSCTYCCPCVAMFVRVVYALVVPCVVCCGASNDVAWFTLFGNAACTTVVGLYFAFLPMLLAFLGISKIFIV